jgi:hypothetical protein
MLNNSPQQHLACRTTCSDDDVQCCSAAPTFRQGPHSPTPPPTSKTSILANSTNTTEPLLEPTRPPHVESTTGKQASIHLNSPLLVSARHIIMQHQAQHAANIHAMLAGHITLNRSVCRL